MVALDSAARPPDSMVKLPSAARGPAPLLSIVPASGRESAVGRRTMLQSGRENLRHRGSRFGSATSRLQVRASGLRGTAGKARHWARSLPGPLPLGEDGGERWLAGPGTGSLAPAIPCPGGGEDEPEPAPIRGQTTEPQAQALNSRLGLRCTNSGGLVSNQGRMLKARKARSRARGRQRRE
jgi:hypothetical protein